jgi:hypothetical protein
MGKVGDALFGKKPKPESSESGNLNNSLIKNAFGGMMGYGEQGGDAMAALLGLGGAGAQTAALDKWADSGGMNFLMDQGRKAITSSKAAQGLLQSGSFGTALTKYGQGLGSTYLNQYMDQLLNLSKLGLGAGGLVAQTGQYSKGTGATQGKAGILPMAIAAFA